MESLYKTQSLYSLRSLLSVENDGRRTRVEVEPIAVVQIKDKGGLTRLVAVQERKAHRFTASRQILVVEPAGSLTGPMRGNEGKGENQE